MDQKAMKEFVLEYVSELKDLTFNSKSLINTLTMLAGDNLEIASSIAAAIEKHILTVGLCLLRLCPRRQLYGLMPDVGSSISREITLTFCLPWLAVCSCP